MEKIQNLGTKSAFMPTLFFFFPEEWYNDIRITFVHFFITKLEKNLEVNPKPPNHQN